MRHKLWVVHVKCPGLREGELMMGEKGGLNIITGSDWWLWADSPTLALGRKGGWGDELCWLAILPMYRIHFLFEDEEANPVQWASTLSLALELTSLGLLQVTLFVSYSSLSSSATSTLRSIGKSTTSWCFVSMMRELSGAMEKVYWCRVFMHCLLKARLGVSPNAHLTLLPKCPSVFPSLISVRSQRRCPDIPGGSSSLLGLCLHYFVPLSQEPEPLLDMGSMWPQSSDVSSRR